MPVGTQVHAVKSGVVVYCGATISAYGNMIIVNHGDGWASCYAHNSRNLVRVNQTVSQGDVIALSGESPRIQGPGLHFQLRHNGDAVDPVPYLP